MIDDNILEFVDVSLRANVGIGLLLDNISFAIAPKSRVAVIGPSGAGKTSLLRLMNRLSDPTSGVIHYRQQPLSSYPVVELRRRIGLVLQEPRLLGQSVKSALCYPAQLQGIDEDAAYKKIQPWLEPLKIPQDWLLRQSVDLSVGQRQRVAIARTLATQPDILLLDEPTAAQDIGYAQYLLTYLGNPEFSSTVIMVNHQLDLMESWATHMIYLHQGQLVSYQPVTQVDWHELRQRIVAAQKDESWHDDL
ncbi:MAG: ATP-binding cassette domain-containing protein [Cyanobacteria bacterium P01_D01_bin.156]